MELIEINEQSDIETLEKSIDKVVWYRDKKTNMINISNTRGENGYTYAVDFRNGETLEVTKSVAEYEKYQLIKSI